MNVSLRPRVRGAAALDRFIAALDRGASVLDIGSGDGRQAALLRTAGFAVTTVDAGAPADVVGDFMDVTLPAAFDAVWCCHVLEHQRNPGAFLERLAGHVRPGGLIAVTVPPAKPEIVGGHVTLWNAGLLLYNLVLAGFDCRRARVGTYGYNVSVIVPHDPMPKPTTADIDDLAPYFPVPVHHGFDGRLTDVNW